MDGDCDLVDIDMLSVESGMGTNDLSFDLTNDGLVDRDDLQLWLVEAGARPENVALTDGNPFLEGDANLDGAVDGLDFIAWNDAKFTSAKLWSTGNFDGSAVTDGVDFLVWNDNKFQTSALVSAPDQRFWTRPARSHWGADGRDTPGPQLDASLRRWSIFDGR